jgi:type VI secretion system protein VasJ
VNAILQAAALLRTADPSKPWSYRLTRMCNWIAIHEPPPVAEGRTLVPPPEGYAVTAITELVNGQKWFDVLMRAEELTPQYLFWLDLHRYVSTSMERIGPQFLAAREAVGREVVAFASRMGNVDALCFNDGTPFADAQTRAWLEEEMRKHGGGGGSAAAAAASAEDEEIAKRFAEAQKMVTEGKVADGLSTALALADRAADGRTRFRSRMSVAKMALDAAKHDLARSMFEHLVADIERHGLDTWEPTTSASVYTNLIVATREVARAKGGSPELASREQHLFDKLCRLDPASAIKLST